MHSCEVLVIAAAAMAQEDSDDEETTRGLFLTTDLIEELSRGNTLVYESKMKSMSCGGWLYIPAVANGAVISTEKDALILKCLFSKEGGESAPWTTKRTTYG